MAEAHHATHYSASLTHEHHKVRARTSWTRWMTKCHNQILNWIYPAHLEGIVLVTGIVTSLYFGERWFAVRVIDGIVEKLPNSSLPWKLLACSSAGFTCWFMICLSMKMTLKFLLSYQGYMFEGRGKQVSLRTKIWGALLRLMIKWNPPRLQSFQCSLPTLPVPPLKDTIKRYLRSIRPILDDENFARVEREAKDFENGIGKKLQRYLILKSWWSKNYVSDWWEEYVYLRNTGPLMINSNVYCSDNIARPTQSQTARAANVCYLLLKFREKIDNETLPPIMAQGVVPLCSWQYKRLFNTTRVPGLAGDKVIHYDDSQHLAVYHKGCFYKVILYRKGKLLNAREIQYQLEWIVNSKEVASHAESYLASLTSWTRTKWAEIRDEYFSSGINKKSLEVVESAAFMLILNDEPFEMELVNLTEDRSKIHQYAGQCLHGKVYNYWFDKSFNVNVGTNGRGTFNAEHSWADAPIVSRMLEETMADDIHSYGEDGNPKGEIKVLPPNPIRLEWDFSEAKLVKSIDEAYADGLKLVEDVNIQIDIHNAFGKGFIKTCNLSPDAFIQMALQLAYFRDFGRFSLTYEASMTRLYIQGRTETVRSCTIESSAWVRSMDDEKSSTAERVKLLQEACKQHQKGYLEAMTGKGIDRHLFCLYVVSKYLEVESPFLQELINEPWRLSTSQTPHGQTAKVDLIKYPELKGCAGGFGPVAYDGYSVSYIISGEDVIYFHISSVKSCPITNTERFGKRIFKAMADMRRLMEEFQLQKKM